ncbi:MAG TPA: hypothetical protein PKD85_00910 [Saprospiraceae bacterium]|nr:hypothetical protein [Saprospiraceae bacterium]
MSILFKELEYSNLFDSNAKLFRLLPPTIQINIKLVLACLKRLQCVNITKSIWQNILCKLCPVTKDGVYPDKWDRSVYRWMKEYWLNNQTQNPLLIYCDQLNVYTRLKENQIGYLTKQKLCGNTLRISKMYDIFIGIYLPNIDIIDTVQVVTEDVVIGTIDLKAPRFYQIRTCLIDNNNLTSSVLDENNVDRYYKKEALPFYSIPDIPIIPMASMIYVDLYIKIRYKDRDYIENNSISILGTLIPTELRNFFKDNLSTERFITRGGVVYSR